MTRTIRGRFIGFVLAICGVSGLLGWAAHSSWKRGGELAEKLSSLELQSFQIASHLQQTILQMDNLVLRYGGYHNPRDWARFEQTSTNLDQWIDLKRPSLASDNEKRLLDEINTNYDSYMAAAWQIRNRTGPRQPISSDLSEFADFEAQSQTILKLGSDLARAHLESMDDFFKSSKRTLGYLRLVLLNSLILLLLAGVGLAILVLS